MTKKIIFKTQTQKKISKIYKKEKKKKNFFFKRNSRMLLKVQTANNKQRLLHNLTNPLYTDPPIRFELNRGPAESVNQAKKGKKNQEQKNKKKRY